MELFKTIVEVAASVLTIASIIGGVVTYRYHRGITKRMARLIKELLFTNFILKTLSTGGKMTLLDLEHKVVKMVLEDPRWKCSETTEEGRKILAKDSFRGALEVVKTGGIGLVDTNYDQMYHLTSLGKTLIKRMKEDI